MKVLVVDDEADTRSLFTQRFRHEVRDGRVAFRFADSAESALDTLEADGLPDLVLVLSDINLPGVSGLDLLKAIRERKVHAPVYMIAPPDGDGRKAVAERLGADGFLSKPLDFDQLRRDVLRLP